MKTLRMRIKSNGNSVCSFVFNYIIFLPYEGRHLWLERLIAIVQLQQLEYPLVNLHKKQNEKRIESESSEMSEWTRRKLCRAKWMQIECGRCFSVTYRWPRSLSPLAVCPIAVTACVNTIAFDRLTLVVPNCANPWLQHQLYSCLYACDSRKWSQLSSNQTATATTMSQSTTNVAVAFRWKLNLKLTYVAKSCTIRFNAFDSFFCGTEFGLSRSKSPLLAITAGLLFIGCCSKCVRSFVSEF